MLIETYLENILKSHYKIFEIKYLFIKMSFYLFIAILCLKMSSVYKPFKREIYTTSKNLE